jgi:hypothetical protein
MNENRRISEDNWIPLIDYAIKKGVSLSTLRRHIKANKVIYKVENGRYLLKDEDSQPIPVQTLSSDSSLQASVQRLERDLQRAQEEIAELKTLIAFYEESIPQNRLNN